MEHGRGRVADKVALITGAASGIGAAAARLLAAHGAKVVIADRDLAGAQAVAGEIAAEGTAAEAVRLDVTDELDWMDAIRLTIARFGRLDILVACAGVADGAEPLLEFDYRNWRRILAINLDGIFLGLCHAGPAILGSGGGSVVNVSSVASRAAVPNGAAYCASKAAVAQLTKVAALEWAPRGIRVNSVHPGYTETPMTAAIFGDDERTAAIRAAAIGKHPVGRLGQPEEIAQAILFLASAESSFVTGAEIVADGGYSLP